MNKLLKTKYVVSITALTGMVSLIFPANALATDPPAAGLAVWYKADAGVSQDPNGVTVWQDQSGNGNHANRALGGPQLATATFPNGTHDVLRFDGGDALRLTDASATQLTNFNIFIVANYDAGAVNERLFSNYSVGTMGTQYGYSLGTNGLGSPLWWYFGSSEMSAGTYTAGKNYLTVYTLKNSVKKELYVFHEDDGLTGYGGETGSAPIQYSSSPALPPHYCDIGAIWIEWEGYGWYGGHRGDIAEILVYDLADPDFIALQDPNAAFDGVRAYVNEKYGMDITVARIDPDPIINAELAACWQFEETTGSIALDSSNNNNDGVLVSGFDFDSSSAPDRFGHPTGALTFDGISDWILVAHDASIDCFPQVTIAAWVKVPGPEKIQATLICKALAVAVGSNYRDYELMVDSDQRVMSWMANSAHPTYVGNTTGTPGGVSSGVWHHIAATHDGTGITLYLDGEQDGYKVAMNDLESTAPADLFIGRSVPEFGDRFWAGDVDEIAIWNGGLTAGNILYIYENVVPLPSPNCKGVGEYLTTDLNRDCYVNLEDFAMIAQNWLKCNDPLDPACTDIP